MWWLSDKNLPANAGDTGSIPRSGRSPWKKMATHSNILAWKFPRTEKPGGLQMGSQVLHRTWQLDHHHQNLSGGVRFWSQQVTWKLRTIRFCFKSFAGPTSKEAPAGPILIAGTTDLYLSSLALSLFPSEGLLFQFGELNEQSVQCHWIILSSIKSVLGKDQGKLPKIKVEK